MLCHFSSVKVNLKPQRKEMNEAQSSLEFPAHLLKVACIPLDFFNTTCRVNQHHCHLVCVDCLQCQWVEVIEFLRNCWLVLVNRKMLIKGILSWISAVLPSRTPKQQKGENVQLFKWHLFRSSPVTHFTEHTASVLHHTV